MTSLTRTMSAFFLTLIVCLIVSTANGLDIVRASQGSLYLAWVCALLVLMISLLLARVHAVRARLWRQ